MRLNSEKTPNGLNSKEKKIDGTGLKMKRVTNPLSNSFLISIQRHKMH